ncbi:MAG: YcxB family protein [Lawsonibacter sp.]
MEFQNKTIYSRKTLEKLNQAVNWVMTKKTNPANRVLSMVIPLAILGSGFYLLQKQGPSPLAIAELVIGGFLMVWIPFFHRFQAWMASKLMLKGNPEYTLDFDEKGYVVSSTTTHGEPTEKFEYNTVWRLCETTDYFIMMLNKRSGYILDKNGFTKGSADSFRIFLEGKADMPFERIAL